MRRYDFRHSAETRDDAIGLHAPHPAVEETATPLGPRKDGADALYATNVSTEIDEDAREEYWSEIRKKPELKSSKHT